MGFDELTRFDKAWQAGQKPDIEKSAVYDARNDDYVIKAGKKARFLALRLR